MKKIIFIVAAIIVGAMVVGAVDSIRPFGEPVPHPWMTTSSQAP
jgi:hypothetical protein